MEDQGREVDALSWMSLEVGLQIHQDLVPICANDVELDYIYFSNNGIHDGWA